MRRILLEEAAFKVCEQSSVSPLIFQLPPTKGRKQLEDRQNSTVNMYPANIQCEKVQINGREEITTYFITPKENTSVKVLFFIFMVRGGCLAVFIPMKISSRIVCTYQFFDCISGIYAFARS
ncbi:MAG: hypothetical protein ACLRRA_03220 [Acutalibacteraceae bacterium]